MHFTSVWLLKVEKGSSPAENCVKGSDNLFHDQFCRREYSRRCVGFKGRLYPNYKADAYAPWRDEKYSSLRNSLQRDGIYQAD